MPPWLVRSLRPAPCGGFPHRCRRGEIASRRLERWRARRWPRGVDCVSCLCPQRAYDPTGLKLFEVNGCAMIEADAAD